MLHRRVFLAAAAALLPASLVAPGALAHHGWRWVSDEEFTLTGVIRSARLGNPHGIIEVETAEGELWTAELGQPWRHAAAGLDEALIVPGVEITVEGHRSADPAQRVMKAERVILAGMRYTLYPDRSS
jgi:hypothetical protein